MQYAVIEFRHQLGNNILIFFVIEIIYIYYFTTGHISIKGNTI
jgi:hypothetical protein